MLSDWLQTQLNTLGWTGPMSLDAWDEKGQTLLMYVVTEKKLVFEWTIFACSDESNVG